MFRLAFTPLWAWAASPLALVALLVFAPDASAGPPGPWVFIPPPGSSTGAVPGSGASNNTTTVPKPFGPTASSKDAPKEDGMEVVRKATVVLERGKKAIALGVLLADRSFILTARSAVLSAPGDVDVRFPDSNTTTKAKLVHEDAAWDLALLVPQTAKGEEGARASDTDPLSTSVSFSSFVLLKTGKLQAQPANLLGRRDYLSPDGDTLKDALSIDNKALAIGTPIVDGNGGVVAIVGRACAPGSPKATIAGKGICMPQLFGTPLAQLKKFLKSAPLNPRPFAAILGISGAPDPLGVRVTDVRAGSAAAAAGLRASDDVVISVDGQVVRTIDELHEKIAKHSPGDVVTLLVARAGGIREAKVPLKDDDSVKSSSLPPTAYTPLPPLPPLPNIVIKPVPMGKK